MDTCASSSTAPPPSYYNFFVVDAIILLSCCFSSLPPTHSTLQSGSDLSLSGPWLGWSHILKKAWAFCLISSFPLASLPSVFEGFLAVDGTLEAWIG